MRKNRVWTWNLEKKLIDCKDNSDLLKEGQNFVIRNVKNVHFTGGNKWQQDQIHQTE